MTTRPEPQPRPGSWHRDVVGTLCRIARQRPDQPAVIDPSGTTTFGDLFAAAAYQARHLETQTDHLVGVLALSATPTAGFLTDVCAALLAGWTPLPVPARAPDSLTVPAVQALQEARLAGCRPWKAALTVHQGRQELMLTHGESPTVARKARALGMLPGGRALIAAPLHLSEPFEVVLRQLLLGGTVVLTPPFSPERWLATVHRERPDWAYLATTQLQQLCEHADQDDLRRRTAALRLLVHPGAPLAPALRERLRASLGPGRLARYYGTSVYDGTFAAYDAPGLGAPPIPGTELRIVDRHRWPVMPGDVGVIEGRSAIGPVTHRADQSCPSGPLWFGAGHLGRRVADSDRIEVIDATVPGRAVVADVPVALADTHDALARHPAITSCTVTARAHDRFGSVLAAVVHTTDPNLTVGDLRRWCAHRLTTPQRPHHFELRTGSGALGSAIAGGSRVRA